MEFPSQTNPFIEALLTQAGLSQEATYRVARLHQIVEGIKKREAAQKETT